MARKWECFGIVNEVEGDTAVDMNGPAMLVDPKVDVDLGSGGWLSGLRIASSVEDARDLLGKRVRVTLEVVDG